jgi:hypothetical protein
MTPSIARIGPSSTRRARNKTLEILDRIELAKIAGFDPAYIEGWGQGSSSFGSI